jgi:hypothetical protein
VVQYAAVLRPPVLDGFGGFGDADAAGRVGAGADDLAVEGIDDAALSGVEPLVTFLMVVRRCSWSPGLMRSGL